jgi:large subunit ribosomal protein L37Ae
MTVKTKKVKSAGRFGARYGRAVKDRVVNVEEKQRSKQKCPFCSKLGIKRMASGIWKCPRCEKTFASDAYYLEK